MKKEKTIALLTCWYGAYPWYFTYFVHSCGYNPTIDFFVITENVEIIPNKPDNLKIIHKPFEELKSSFSERLEFEVVINRPYKLCDFKPAYGFLFPEIVKEYDFWGISDIDIIYGDIRSFMTEDILNEFEIISSRHDYITGSFCLFKNNEYINTLFMKSRDYEMVFSTEDNFCFDECNYLFPYLRKGFSIFDFKDNIQSMTYIVQKEELEGKLKAYFNFIIIEGTPGKIKWSKGKIYYKDLFEAMYYHLIKFKDKCKQQKIYDPVPEELFFTRTQLLKKKYK